MKVRARESLFVYGGGGLGSSKLTLGLTAGVSQKRVALSFVRGESHALVDVQPNTEYQLAIAGTGLLYLHPELVTAEPRATEHVEIELTSVCRLSGRIMGLPGSQAFKVVELASARSAGVRPRAVTDDEGSFEFNLYGLPPPDLQLVLVVSWGKAPLVAEDSEVLSPCKGVEYSLRTAEELIGIAILSPEGDIEPWKYELELSAKPEFSFSARDPAVGVQVVPKSAFEASERVAFYNIDSYGLLGFERSAGVALESQIVGYVRPGYEDAAGSIRVQLDRDPRAGETPAEVVVALSDFRAATMGREPSQVRGRRSIVIGGLTPEVYDVYWKWGGRYKRLIKRGVSVESGAEIVVSARLLVSRRLTGVVADWETIPPEMRPNRAKVGGTPTGIMPDGTFSLDAGVPLPFDAELFVDGIAIAGSAMHELSTDKVTLTFEVNELTKCVIIVPSLDGGRIRGYFARKGGFGRFLGAEMPFSAAATRTSDELGEIVLPLDEGSSLSAVFYETDKGRSGGMRLRGWRREIPPDGLNVWEFPGRMVTVVLKSGAPARDLRVFGRYEAHGWTAPLAYLGEFAFKAGSEELWLPNHATGIVFTDGRGVRLGEVAVVASMREVLF